MSLLLDALHRRDAQAPAAAIGDALADAAPGAAAVSVPSDAVSRAQQAAQSLLGTRAKSAGGFFRGANRAGLLAVVAAVLLLPGAAWLGWMAWQDSQPLVPAVPPPMAAEPPQPVAAVPLPPPEPALVQPPAEPATAASVAPLAAASAPEPAPAPTPPPTAASTAAVVALPHTARNGSSPSQGAAPARDRVTLASTSRPVPRAASAGAQQPEAAPPAMAQPALVRSTANRQLQEAWEALGSADSARALALYREVLTERPDDPDATLGVAVALHQQKEWPAAWQAYQKSLQLWPDNATARTGLLAILSVSDAATAESRLVEWVQSHPRDAAAQAALANLLGRQGRWAEALPLWERAQSLEPTQATYAYNLAVALDRSHRYAQASQQYQLALQLGGTGVPVVSVRQRIDELNSAVTP